jgi:integrase
MERQEIYQRIDAAKKALKPKGAFAKGANEAVTHNAHNKYMQDAKRIFGTNPKDGKIMIPNDADSIIQKVRSVSKKSTLRKYARSVRYASSKLLIELIKQFDKKQRDGDWNHIEKVARSPMLTSLTKLAQMMPVEYGEGWESIKARKGKKSSLRKLPDNWRELMAAESTGKFRLPMMVALITGCRPAELEKGVRLKIYKGSLYVRIIGAKVKVNAGQEYRQFKLADHPITTELMQIISSYSQSEIMVQVDKGNSVSTHMRNVASKIWPKRKESITAYTARHAMAADCKAAIDKGADENLVSQVLGHAVDKTATYYGFKSQSGSKSVAPSNILVPKLIRQKYLKRSKERVASGLMQNHTNRTKVKNKLHLT